jgi:hypothetical protein
MATASGLRAAAAFSCTCFAMKLSVTVLPRPKIIDNSPAAIYRMDKSKAWCKVVFNAVDCSHDSDLIGIALAAYIGRFGDSVGPHQSPSNWHLFLPLQSVFGHFPKHS